MAQFVMVEAQKLTFFDILWLHVITTNLQQQIDQSESFPKLPIFLWTPQTFLIAQTAVETGQYNGN